MKMFQFPASNLLQKMLYMAATTKPSFLVDYNNIASFTENFPHT